MGGCGSVFLLFILNSCQIRMSFDEQEFFSYTDCNFSHSVNAIVPLSILKQTFSGRCIRMVELAISSIDLHSSAVIEAGFSRCQMALTYLHMISTSCTISFHRAKFLSSNFPISQLGSNVEALVLMEFLVSMVLSFKDFSSFCIDVAQFQYCSDTSWKQYVWCLGQLMQQY